METDEEKVSEGFEDYLNEKFGGKEPDLEIEDYLNDKFNELPLPRGQKKCMTISEMLNLSRDKRF